MADPTIPHLCHLRPDCKVPVPRSMVMCKPHWAMVPFPLKRAIWTTYKTRMQSTADLAAHLANMHAAIDYVRSQLGLPARHRRLTGDHYGRLN